MSDQTESSPRLGDRIRANVWNRKIWVGLLCAVPSLFGFATAQVVDASFDRTLFPLEAREQVISKNMGILDNLTRRYEGEELLRVSFRLTVFANGGNDDFAFRLDQVHRASGLNFLRHITFMLGKPELDERVKDYETTVLSDYRQNGGAARLQDSENTIIKEAKAWLTHNQEELDPLQEKIRVLKADKEKWHDLFTYLGWAASIIAFFVKNNN